MPNVLMGQRVKELVRRYFMEGVKSSNKLYATDFAGKDVPATEKAEKRERHQDDAAHYQYQIQNSFHESGETGSSNYARQLLDLQAEVRSGNCGEMSDVAAYLVQ